MIKISDVKEVFAREGRKISDESLNLMMREVQSKQSGMLDFDDFEKMMAQDIDEIWRLEAESRVFELFLILFNIYNNAQQIQIPFPR